MLKENQSFAANHPKSIIMTTNLEEDKKGNSKEFTAEIINKQDVTIGIARITGVCKYCVKTDVLDMVKRDFSYSDIKAIIIEEIADREIINH